MKLINKIYLPVIFTLTMFCLTYCESKYDVNPPDGIETMNSGRITVYCDSSVYNLLDTTFTMYDKQYSNVILSDSVVSSRETMRQLLSGNARVVINARDYLKDEDSLMQAHEVGKHRRFRIADDGLVFFVNKDFPIDTLNAQQIQSYYLVEGYRLSDNVEGLTFEPKTIIAEKYTSEYANFDKLVLNNKRIINKQNLNFVLNTQAVKEQILNDNTIGIAYLHQIINDNRFKMLRIGFTNVEGARIPPMPVHQSYLVQDKYPYKVSIYVYLLEDRQNLPFWFASYIGKQTKVQKYLLDAGLVPAFARLKLIPEDY